MWLRSVSCARGVHARDDALALVQLAGQRLEHERLVVAEAHDVDTRARSRRPRTRHAAVGHLAAAGRVERRLDELGQHAAVLAAIAPTAVACSVVS